MQPQKMRWRAPDDAPSGHVAVLDDFFPNPISGFRFEEFVSYLDELQGVAIYCDGAALSVGGDARPVEAVIDAHFAMHPEHIGRVHPLRPGPLPSADAYYAIFLNNISRYLDAVERAGKPFAFTLYPGGGFRLNEKASDEKLDRSLTVRSCVEVIVTQPNTRDYVLKRHAGLEARMSFVPGGVIPRLCFCLPVHRKHFGFNKDTLDVGFVANRYTPRGADKGYDLFVETARELRSRGVAATYHVVGPWDANVLPLGDLAAQFVFHGFVGTEMLRSLALTFDLILSPNRPDILANGAFDGFPTGSCVEAGLQEAAILCTDLLRLNREFTDGEDMVLIEPDVGDILQKLMPLISQPAILAQIGKAGRDRLVQFFGRERQLAPRLVVLRDLQAQAVL